MNSVYLETTVVSYYTARPSRDLVIAAQQEATHEIWPKLTTRYECFISTLVHKEASRGDAEQAKRRIEALAPFAVLDVNDIAIGLGDELVQERAIPDKFPEDALHIAICAVNAIDALITWNFAHLGNPFTRRIVRKVIENAGYRCPEICSPNELLEIAP